jgi:CheY-like chemotaxis protein
VAKASHIVWLLPPGLYDVSWSSCATPQIIVDDKGSAFSSLVWFVQSLTALDPSKGETHMAPINRPVIMVVDDDASIRLLLQDTLDDVLYKVILANDGATALTAMATIMPDLVTLDLDLPGITGAQVLELMRQNDQLRAVKVVVISSAAIIPPRVQELAQAIIPKPFDIDTLVEIVQRLVPPPEPHSSKEASA